MPLTDTTSHANNTQNVTEGTAVSTDEAKDATKETKEGKPRAPRQPRGEPREPREPRTRGPPEDGVPSKNKVMVANLPYDLSEEKVQNTVTVYSVAHANNVLAQGTLCCIQPLCS